MASRITCTRFKSLPNQLRWVLESSVRLTEWCTVVPKAHPGTVSLRSRLDERLAFAISASRCQMECIDSFSDGISSRPCSWTSSMPHWYYRDHWGTDPRLWCLSRGKCADTSLWRKPAPQWYCCSAAPTFSKALQSWQPISDRLLQARLVKHDHLTVIIIIIIIIIILFVHKKMYMKYTSIKQVNRTTRHWEVL